MRLSLLAQRQHGVFSRDQALAGDLSAWQVHQRLTSGAWRCVATEVYADASVPLSVAARRWAAVLACGTDAVLSHSSAALAWGMPVIEPRRPEVSVPTDAHRKPGAGVRVRRATVPAAEVCAMDGLPTTSRRRTVLDCLLVLPEPDGRRLLDRALQQRWVTLEEMVGQVGAAARRWGAPRARRVVGAADPGTAAHSERVLQRLLRAAGVEGWVPNHPVRLPDGSRAFVDVAFPTRLLAVEVDGWAWHSDPERFRRDRTRQNLLVAGGWTVLRFTWADLVEQPERVVHAITEALVRLAA